MESNDLRILWQKSHSDINEPNINLREIIQKKHSNIISKVLLRQKKSIWLFAIVSFIALTFAIWDAIITESGDISLWMSATFLIFCTISSFNKYRLLTKTADIFSIKQSTLILKERLERKMKVDFIICLLFFYSITVRMILVLVDNSENLDNIKPILWAFVPILIIIPWFMRYLHKQQYKHYFSSLEKNIAFLESNL